MDIPFLLKDMGYYQISFRYYSRMQYVYTFLMIIWYQINLGSTYISLNYPIVTTPFNKEHCIRNAVLLQTKNPRISLWSPSPTCRKIIVICYILDTCDHLGGGEEPLLRVDGVFPPNRLKHTNFARPIGAIFSFFFEGMNIKIGLKPPPPGHPIEIPLG